MFTPGRIIFASLFAAAFVGYLIWAYAKDAKLSKKYFKGAGFILLILVVIWLLFYTFVKLT
jgi:ABC-type nickel/cobalt efflux system permease component RcnA